jgi:RNase H-fold protein (predicted Holliday junction resolvase)
MTQVGSPERHKYLGIDPGRAKCGIAVIFDDGARESLDVVPTGDIEHRIEKEVRAGGVAALCVGHATTSGAIVRLCESKWPSIPLHVVDETNTTFEARERYFIDHPPRGLWRLIPRGLLVPKGPLDGYAALLIVERFRRFADKTRAAQPAEAHE